MNTELKAFIAMLFDIGTLTQMAIKDKGLQQEEETQALKIFMEAPTDIKNAGIAFSQLKALNAAGEADLIAFLGTELGVTDAKTANIILKGVNFLFSGYQLEQAVVKGPVASAT